MKVQNSKCFVWCRLGVRSDDKTLALIKDSDKTWKANFNFQRVAPDQLTLDGDMDSHKIHMQLQLLDPQ